MSETKTVLDMFDGWRGYEVGEYGNEIRKKRLAREITQEFLVARNAHDRRLLEDAFVVPEPPVLLMSYKDYIKSNLRQTFITMYPTFPSFETAWKTKFEMLQRPFYTIPINVRLSYDVLAGHGKEFFRPAFTHQFSQTLANPYLINPYFS